MSIYEKYEPGEVLRFFELCSSVPHGSGNTGAIADICVNFARERGLEHYRDELNNVIIIKEATAGYESAEPVILQGHLDMVCTKEDDCTLDMAKEPIRLAVTDGWLHAVGTTLGGDNIVAIAMIMAILDRDDLSHPRIEAVFTVDEEVGMDGAVAIDLSMLKGRRMINLDSEEEGALTVGCAGGARVDCTLPVEREALPADYKGLAVRISGLKGGHSGVDIDKGRASSHRLMARFLSALIAETGARIVHLDGGKFDNVIPLCTEAEVALPASQAERAMELARQWDGIFKNEYETADSGVTVAMTETEVDAPMLTEADSVKLIRTMLALPQGVIEMSMDFDDLVQTSLNMGVLHLRPYEAEMSFSVRSSIHTQKLMLIERLEAVMALAGGKISVRGQYPGWQYRKVSPLRDIIASVYRDQSGKDAFISATHGGLECGMFIEKLPGLDCVSLGPDLRDVHSTRERLNLASTERLWKMMIEILRKMK